MPPNDQYGHHEVLDRETDRKIAEWLGWEFSHEQSPGQSFGPWYWTNPQKHGNRVILPNFAESITSAIKLLPVLLEKGYVSSLFVAHSEPDQWQCDIAKSSDYDVVARGIQPTISHAITEAMMQLIDATEQRISGPTDSGLLLSAAKKTLNDNLHLCDGDDCTLKDLRDAVAAIDPEWEG